MHEAYGEDRFASPPTLTKLVECRALRPQDGHAGSTTTRASVPSPSSSGVAAPFGARRSLVDSTLDG